MADPMARRTFAMGIAGSLSAAVLASLAGCAPAAGVVAPVGPPIVPAVPLTGAAAAADKIRLISDAIGTALPTFGLDGGKIATVTAAVGKLAGIAEAILAGGSLSSLVSNAGGVLAGLQTVLTGGNAGAILDAAFTLWPVIAQFAGIQSRRLGRQASSMDTATAEAILRRAARRP